MTVRVRIAPSPTGDPHVGTAYIGLINHCFARRHGGRFILRIEDTDRSRCTEASAQAIYASLKWLKLDYDEGPDVGGDRGPYVQSERVALGIYRREVDRLVAAGHAYPCFCTAEHLDAMRKRQLAAKQPVMYDRTCRDLAPAEAAARVARGEAHVIRMKVPLAGEHAYKDRLRKQPVVKAWAEIDDQVLLKSDGWPTYHLAAVVDDHQMGITHVIRAEEWLNSLPKHILLNGMLGYQPPEYVHVGLLRNADKSKISKRKNPTNLLWYKAQGYLPEAMVNFLATLGHSMPDGREKFSLAELIGVFDLDRINVAGPVFDLQKLRHLQGQWFRELAPERMKAEVHRAIDERIDRLLPLLRERMVFGGDFLEKASPFYAETVDPHADDLVPKGLDKAQAKQVLEQLQAALRRYVADEAGAWTAAALEAHVGALLDERAAAEVAGQPPAADGTPAPAKVWSRKAAFMLLRVAVTGRKESPPLFDTLELVGATRVIERLGAAAAKLR